MSYYAALHLPGLPLTCLLAREQIDSSLPAALLSSGKREKSSLLHLNEIANSFQLSIGMNTTRALARCPELTLYDADSKLETQARAEALALLDTFTPDYEDTGADTFLLDLSTVLFASREEWLHQALEISRQLGLPLNLSLADTPDLAHLAALSCQTSSSLRYQPKASLSVLSEPPSICDLPLDLLRRNRAFPLPQADLLQLWGLRTLGDLIDLPRQGLGERLGPELARLHDVLTGKHHRLLKLSRPRQDYQTSHHFEPPVEGVDPLLFMARRLLQALCQRLASQQRAAEALHLVLSFENGAAYSRQLRQSEPTLDPDILLRSLHTHLDSFHAPAPISEFHLRLLPTLPHQAQHQLFQRGLSDPHKFADTLKRLSGVVGIDQLGIPQPAGNHRPGEFDLHPLEADLNIPTPSEPIPAYSRLPLKRQRPPLVVRVASEKRGRHLQPLALLSGPHQGTIQDFRGPFPLSGSWWESPWQQSEWDVALPKNLLLQVTHTPPHDWHLTGIYG